MPLQQWIAYVRHPEPGSRGKCGDRNSALQARRTLAHLLPTCARPARNWPEWGGNEWTGAERYLGSTELPGSVPRGGGSPSCACSWTRTTTPDASLPTAPNVLERDTQAHLPNRVWSTDIIYVPTREGWLYLAVVEDLFSGRIVGWTTATSLELTLPLEVGMALWAGRARQVPWCAPAQHRRNMIESYFVNC